jgi:hypothetical protein
MPYEGEYAAYKPLKRIVECERVQQLLTRSKVYQRHSDIVSQYPLKTAPKAENIPKFILAIDGSYAEVAVKNGYPGAKVGYCTVASVLIDLALVNKIDTIRPFDPRQFRKTENASSIDSALPGSNVVTRRQISARASFREELYDHFNAIIVDEDERMALIDTYESLLSLKPHTHPQACPYNEDDGCQHHFSSIPARVSECPLCKRHIYSTDALRIHERFNDLGSNGEAFGLVTHIWEQLLLIHLLRCFEKKGLLPLMDNLAFFIDGPLAVFGPPAWLSASISKELKRINSIIRDKSGSDLMIIGIEKTGLFVSHFDEIDHTETPGKLLFDNGQYMLLTDRYIKQRVHQSISPKRYGQDTYFGRKFFYKTASGARIVANIPFLSDEQDNIDSDDITPYPKFKTYLALLDQFVSSRYANSLTPIISAHAEASIPLNLGAKVLTQLARALMGEI